MTLEKHYTVKEVAAILSMGQRTIWGWVKSGKLKAVKVGKIVRIPASELARLGFSVREDTGDRSRAGDIDEATAMFNEHKRMKRAMRRGGDEDE